MLKTIYLTYWIAYKIVKQVHVTLAETHSSHPHSCIMLTCIPTSWAACLDKNSGSNCYSAFWIWHMTCSSTFLTHIRFHMLQMKMVENVDNQVSPSYAPVSSLITYILCDKLTVFFQDLYWSLFLWVCLFTSISTQIHFNILIQTWI